jgi:hypothetical protein
MYIPSEASGSLSSGSQVPHFPPTSNITTRSDVANMQIRPSFRRNVHATNILIATVCNTPQKQYHLTNIPSNGTSHTRPHPNPSV